MKRRDFLGGAGSIALLSGCKPAPKPPPLQRSPHPQAKGAPAPDAALVELANVALDAATRAGASYADVRIADYRNRQISTREKRVQALKDEESRGFGVRVIADGAWGFAASSVIDKDEIARIAVKAVEVAKSNAALRTKPVQLAPAETYVGVWNTPIRIDPFAVSLDDQVQRLLSINAEALKNQGVNFCTSSMDFVKEHKLFASTDGSAIEQTLHRNNARFTVTSIDRKRNSFETRNSYSTPQGMGYEYIEDYPWIEDARQAAEDARAKHTAPSVEPGRYDLVLHPSHLWLTVHESIGHPTELDRALGLEANFAGTSFLTVDKMGGFRIGSDIVNFVAERTAHNSLATCGYDDDGDKCTEWHLVKDGIFVDYQTTRDQASWINRKRGYACSYGQSWKDVAFQRMPNINLVPGKQPLSQEQIISGVENGIFIKGRGSFSIDHQRYNFQFGGQTFWAIKNGKLAGMVKDVAYQARTPDFWKACDAIGGKETYEVGGTFYDGKGQPRQSNGVSHGCPPARFRQINVLNTARKV
jgi:TldD protein